MWLQQNFLYTRTVATLCDSYHGGRWEGLDHGQVKFGYIDTIWGSLLVSMGEQHLFLWHWLEVGIYMEQKHSRMLVPLSVGRWALPIHEPLKSWYDKNNSNAQ